jgi:hypothetical protein
VPDSPTPDRDRLPLEFRLPLTGWLVPLIGMVPIVVASTVNNSIVTWQWAVAILAIAVLAIVFRWRWRLVLDDAGVAVTYLTTTRIPWVDVRGFERGSFWFGGVRIRTDHGVVRSAVPTNWWGGASTQVVRLEHIRCSHQA